MPISKQEHEDLNLKATELRLGLPGSESPERSSTNAVKNLVSRAKRGYSDTINIGSSTWGLSHNGGCEVGFVKNGGFLSENKNSDYVKGEVASSKHVLHDNHSQDSLSASK
ncbi:putative AUX/IAA protein [Helianthus annuus]|nr:putative AUX/IAA protein [Helianthus annuus]KAJ0772421.1 putative AUX/IAA protein [Helianthus annuus]